MYKQVLVSQEMGIPEDDPETTQMRVGAEQIRAMIEREKLPLLAGDTAMDEEMRYERLVCAFFR